MSKRIYAVKELKKLVGRGSDVASPTALGGGVLLETTQHALDGPEHTEATGSDQKLATTAHAGLLLPLSGAADERLAGNGTWQPQPTAGASILLAITEAQHRFIVTAHRGDINPTDGWPEGTLEGYRQAAIKGVQRVDLDLQLTSDGQWVVMHDATVTRTTSSTGNVDSKTLATFLALTIDGGEGYDAGRHASPALHPPSLAMVLEALAPYDIVYQLDNKVAASAGDLATLVVSLGLVGRVILNAGSDAEAAAILAVSPDIALLATEARGGVWDTPNWDAIVSQDYVTAFAPLAIGGVVPVADYGVEDERVIARTIWGYGARGITCNDIDGVLAEVAIFLDEHIADTSDAHSASAIGVADAGGYFSGTDAEAALQELGAAFDTFEPTSHWEVLMTDGISNPPDPLLNEAGDDWLYGEVT